jgi:hypothetical protein
MDGTTKAIVGGTVTVGVVAAAIHWWPSKKAGELEHGKGGHHGPHGAPGAPPPGGPPLPTPAAAPSPSLHDVAPSTAMFTPGAARRAELVRVSHWHEFAPYSEVATRMRHGKFVQLWSVGPDGVTLTAIAEPVSATPELLARAHTDLLHARAIGPYVHHFAHHHRAHDPHMGAAGGKFTPGAARHAPLTEKAKRVSYPPNSEVATTLGGGKWVQLWQVAADGVTLTASHWPVAATPALLTRAKQDYQRASAHFRPAAGGGAKGKHAGGGHAGGGHGGGGGAGGGGGKSPLDEAASVAEAFGGGSGKSDATPGPAGAPIEPADGGSNDSFDDASIDGSDYLSGGSGGSDGASDATDALSGAFENF